MQSLEIETMPSLSIPYRSQREEEILGNYGTRGCGVTALSMVLEYYGYRLSGNELKQLADKTKAYQGEIGWTHSGLIQIARELGLNGYRINYDFTEDSDMTKAIEALTKEGANNLELEMFKKSFEFAKKQGGYNDINRLIDKNIPVIASLSAEFTGLEYSHLVVVTEIDQDGVLINDPWDNGKDFRLEREAFEKYWTRRVIVIYQDGK